MPNLIASSAALAFVCAGCAFGVKQKFFNRDNEYSLKTNVQAKVT